MLPVLLLLAMAAEPVRTVWIAGPPTGLLTRPDVHSVTVEDDAVIVKSAGISLRSLGPLQSPPLPVEAVRQFTFRIPIHPVAETETHARVPLEVIGAFVNGVPIYNMLESASFNGSNIWHYDPMFTPGAPGLLEQLVQDGRKHSPIVGFALDGFPVYGPWTVGKRLRSSYRLRKISKREALPNGTVLTPSQYGPQVSPDAPLGTFAEDYEFVAGSGDLDEFNGMSGKTPEYPDGTYAYFLATDTAGKLAFPYLIGPRYYGHISQQGRRFSVIGKQRLELAFNGTTFRLSATGKNGERIRHFEYVHEKPIHLLIASADLVVFDHIHPALTADNYYDVSYSFPSGGTYHLWADYSLPGESPHVERFTITVPGGKPNPRPSRSDLDFLPSKPLRAGEDIEITLRFKDTAALEPYLGAWAHVITISSDSKSFSHSHPLDAGPLHSHTMFGPPPTEVRILTSFPKPGTYKMWAQFQRAGEVITQPFVLQVAAAGAKPMAGNSISSGAIRIRVTRYGYKPAKITIPANMATTLAFIRDATPNCGAEVIFPALGIRTKIPLGGTVEIKLPPQPAGEIAFSCGMGMYRGMAIAH